MDYTTDKVTWEAFFGLISMKIKPQDPAAASAAAGV